jgi:cellulose synthase operon protein C
MKSNSLAIVKLLAIVVFGLMLTGCSSPEEKAKSYYESGNALLAKNDFARASVEFRNALEIKRDYADAWFGMARVEEHAQDWARMVGDLNKVIELNPAHLQARQTLAKFHLASGNQPEALKLVNGSYEKNPENPDVLAVRAAVLLSLEDRKGAEADVQKALKIDPTNSGAATVRATLLINQGQLAEAQSALDRAIEKHPEDAGLLLVKLRIFEQQKDIAGQEATVRAMVAAFPTNVQYRKGLQNFLIKNGRSDEVEKELRQVLKTNPDDKEAGRALVEIISRAKGKEAARAVLNELSAATTAPATYIMMLSDLDYQAGEKQSAFTLLEDLIKNLKISDDAIAARLNLAGKFLDDQQLDKSTQLIQDVLSNDALNAEALKLKGAIEIKKGNFDAALEALRQAANNSSNPDIRLLLAGVYEKKSSYELALKELIETYRQTDGNVVVGLELAKYFMRHDSADKAEQLLTEIVSKNWSFTEAISLLARIKLEKQDWKSAEDLAKMIEANNGDKKVSEMILGETLLGQQKYDDAITHFRTLVANAPEDVQPLFALVRSYLAVGKITEAREFVESVVSANPKNVAANILLGSILMADNKPLEAQSRFENAIKADPTQPNGYLALSKFHQGQNQLEKSEAVLKDGVGKASDPSILHMALGAISETRGDYGSAIASYQAIVDKKPKDIIAVNNLVSLLSDNESDIEKLKKLLESAAALKDSEIPQFRETYGWLLVQTGDVKTGLSILQQTIKQLDKFGAAHYHLGLAYMKNQNLVEAESALQTAVKLETDPKTIERILKAIDELKSLKK